MGEEEKKELEGIKYICQKNNMKDMKTVLALYNKLMEKNLFHTQAGLDFLEGLKKQLTEAKEINNRDIFGYTGPEEKKKEKEDTDEEHSYKIKFYNSLIINFILLAALAAGFYITVFSKNVNILNYENKLLDKYSAWEAELRERESIVTEKEKALMP